MCTHSSHRRLSSHYHWYATRDGRTLFTRSQQGNIVCALQQLEMQEVCVIDYSTFHERISKKLHGSGTQLPYSVQGWWEWLTRANNYCWWKLNPFLWARIKISKPGLEKKKGRSAAKIHKLVINQTSSVNSFLRFLWLGAHWIWSWCS